MFRRLEDIIEEIEEKHNEVERVYNELFELRRENRDESDYEKLDKLAVEEHELINKHSRAVHELDQLRRKYDRESMKITRARDKQVTYNQEMYFKKMYDITRRNKEFLKEAKKLRR
jgi:hypothetical protein